MTLRKYILVAQNTWDQTIAYRLNFVMWRFRVFLSLITTYFLWLTLLPSGKSIGSYNQGSILTYILGGSIVYSIVLSTRVADVANEITQGDLSNYLMKPVSYIWYYFAKDLGDKAMNIVFSLVELSIFFIIVRPPFFIQTNFYNLLNFFLAITLAIIMNFFLNMLLSFIGFVSSETWAPRFIFFILLSFFAGTLFPLDILPKWLYIILSSLPFSYLVFMPMKIYLGQLTFTQTLISLGTAAFWSVGLYLSVLFAWRKGLKIYGAEGK